MTCLSTTKFLVGILLCFAVCALQSNGEIFVSDRNVSNYTVPKDSNEPCLHAEFVLSVDITYLNATSVNTTRSFDLTKSDYGGACAAEWNTLSITFSNNWTAVLNYTLKSNSYKLSNLEFSYTMDNEQFPDAPASSLNKTYKVGTNDSLSEFQADKTSSYLCASNTPISLENVVVHFTDYHGQAFRDKSSPSGFSTAVTCNSDTNGSSKLVPIIVGSVLGVLVILVLIAYVIGRRKHRPGYQQV